jgi:hypothetical protein
LRVEKDAVILKERRINVQEMTNYHQQANDHLDRDIAAAAILSLDTACPIQRVLRWDSYP